MLNEIIKGVSIKLGSTFGDGYKFYANDVEQGLQTPCFFLAVLKPELSPRPGQRYLSRNPLDIRYIPADGSSNTEMYAMAGELMDALEFITLPGGDLLHGTGMSYEVTDGVLHFFVSYNLPLVKVQEETSMGNLAFGVGIKEE